jgi:hypothetical protein
MLFVWFVYGLAFFVLGLLILVYPKKGSVFRLANFIWLIAGFGILHGINEWIDMFIMLQEPFPPHILKLVRVGTLSGSFLFLLRFGTAALAQNSRKYRPLLALPVILFAAWVFTVAVSTQRLVMADVFARYLLCAPGAFLTAFGLLLQVPEFRQAKLNIAIRNLWLSAVTFMFYALFAGLIVRKTAFFPTDFLNYDLFQSISVFPSRYFELCVPSCLPTVQRGC